MEDAIRIGIDLGGTKIEGLALSAGGAELTRVRVPTPRDDYAGTIGAIVSLVHELEQRVDQSASASKPSVGVGMPGSIVPSTGLVKNANSTWLNGRPFQQDLSEALGRPVRCANDANCLAVSEAADGAAAGAEIVFAVILGTGCGGGVAAHGQIHTGPNGVGGEWGHNPLPWPRPEELPGPRCYCGQYGCLETWISGTGLAEDYNRVNVASGRRVTGPEIVAAAAAGDRRAEESLTRLEDRIGRALATAINILDPDVIVVGGGLSRLQRLYANVPAIVEARLFGGGPLLTPIRPAQHGDSSGVRGAAWLWPLV